MLHPLLLFERGEFQRQLDIFNRGEHRDQVETLEHEADVDVAPMRDFAVAEGAQIFAEHENFSVSRPVHRGDQVQQRRFAGARRPHQRDELAFVDLDVGVPERHDMKLIADKLLRLSRVSG